MAGDSDNRLPFEIHYGIAVVWTFTKYVIGAGLIFIICMVLLSVFAPTSSDPPSTYRGIYIVGIPGAVFLIWLWSRWMKRHMRHLARLKELVEQKRAREDFNERYR